MHLCPCPCVYVICITCLSACPSIVLVNQLIGLSLCLCFRLPVCPPACHLHYMSDSCQTGFLFLSLWLKPLCLPCQAHWDRRRRDVMAPLSDSPQILHALTGLDCGWASKLPATIRDTSERMGLTSRVISQIKPVGDSDGQIHTSIHTSITCTYTAAIYSRSRSHHVWMRVCAECVRRRRAHHV